MAKKKLTYSSGNIVLAAITAVLAIATALAQPDILSTASAQVAAQSPDGAPALQGEAAIRRLREEGLYDSLGDAVAAALYEVRREERMARADIAPAWRASNPAHQYDASFTTQGLSLAPRGAETRQWQALMRLVGYGHGDIMMIAGAATLEARGNRIEYRRAGQPITEWYVNTPEGLEQGFTIEAAPGARIEGQRLRLTLELTGDLRPEESGEGIALREANGEIALNYDGLYAYDARGRELESRMMLKEGSVILEVNDEAAVYPVTIDPTFSQQTRLLADDGWNPNGFGRSVAIYGNTAVVGAPDSGTYSGAVYVFVRSGINYWIRQARLTSDSQLWYDLFGSSVAIYEDTIVVGAPGETSHKGAAYVFVRSGGVWSKQQRISSSISNAFGASVAIDRGTIVVGAPGYLHPTLRSLGFSCCKGGAAVFTNNGGHWSQQQALVASEGGGTDDFGSSVAISGDTVVVGAPGRKSASNMATGAAFVFGRSGTAWNQQQELVASDRAYRDFFGWSVAISGSTIVVGAPGDDTGALDNHGSAYVFERGLTAWNQQQKLTVSDALSDDVLGYSVAISGGMIVVGAPNDDIGANRDQGSAYLFVRFGAVWGQQSKMKMGDGAAMDNFGYSVAISSSGTVVAGAPMYDLGEKVDHGMAYVSPQLFQSQTVFQW